MQGKWIRLELGVPYICIQKFYLVKIMLPSHFYDVSFLELDCITCNQIFSVHVGKIKLAERANLSVDEYFRCIGYKIEELG